MKRVIEFGVMLGVLLMLLLSMSKVYAEDMTNYVKVTDLSIEVEKSIMTNRSFYIPEDENPSKYLNLNLKMQIGNYMYFNQRIESIVGTSQFRHIGYRPEFGVSSSFGIDVYVRHFSGHSLDSNLGRDFPEENVVGIRFRFIGE